MFLRKLLSFPSEDNLPLLLKTDAASCGNLPDPLLLGKTSAVSLGHLPGIGTQNLLPRTAAGTYQSCFCFLVIPFIHKTPATYFVQKSSAGPDTHPQGDVTAAAPRSKSNAAPIWARDVMAPAGYSQGGIQMAAHQRRDTPHSSKSLFPGYTWIAHSNLSIRIRRFHTQS